MNPFIALTKTQLILMHFRIDLLKDFVVYKRKLNRAKLVKDAINKLKKSSDYLEVQI